MTWGASRSGWRRRRHGFAKRGWRSVCVDLAKRAAAAGRGEGGDDGRLLPADAHGDEAGVAGHRPRPPEQSGRESSSPTASTRRSTKPCCGSEASTSSSAVNSKRTSCGWRSRVRAGPLKPGDGCEGATGAGGDGCDGWDSAAEVSSAGSGRSSAAVEIRDAAAPRRAADGRVYGGEPRVQAPVPALPDRAGLRRPLPHRSTGRS